MISRKSDLEQQKLINKLRRCVVLPSDAAGNGKSFRWFATSVGI